MNKSAGRARAVSRFLGSNEWTIRHWNDWPNHEGIYVTGGVAGGVTIEFWFAPITEAKMQQAQRMASQINTWGLYTAVVVFDEETRFLSLDLTPKRKEDND